jgi:copper chaperone CopZ
MRIVQLVAGAALLYASAGVVAAGDVEVSGVHLCCPACVRAVAGALGDVDGVSNAACDREAKKVTFTAANEEAAQAGVDALAEAGFHGSAKHGDDELEFPESGAKEDAKANEITVTGVHLCCPACVRAVGAAVNDVDGVSDASCDREKKTCTVSGENISVEALVAALNKAGFHANVEE